MKLYSCLLVLIILPNLLYAKKKPYEIFGIITGEYKGKVSLSIEKFVSHDSLQSEIKDGKFYFKGTVPQMPILAKLHMGKSFIVDLYLDGPHTYITCTNQFNISKDFRDTVNMFKLVKVKGSKTNQLKSGFEFRLQQISNEKASEEEKRLAFYNEIASFVKVHPESKVSAYLISKAWYLSYDQLSQLESLLSPSLSNTVEYSEMMKLLKDKYRTYYIGTQFQDTGLKDKNTNDLQLKQLLGKYTLVVCWGSWCIPCRKENPDLNALYAEYKEKGLQLIGVSFDDEVKDWLKAIEKDHLTWPQFIDTGGMEGNFARHYGISKVPVNFLLDQEGKIIGIDVSIADIKNKLK